MIKSVLSYIKSLSILTVVVLLFQQAFAQFKIPEKPEFQTSVYDYTDLLSSSPKSALENKLVRYSDTTSTQIVIVIISSTNGENINYLGANWGEKWGIGQENEDNGVLIILAKDDRTISINTGKGVEHLLTDALSKRIIENIIIPQFRNGDYFGGLDKGSDAIFAVLQGEFQGTRIDDQNEGVNPYAFLVPVIIIIVIFILIRRFGRGGRGGNRSAAGDILTAIILSNMGRSGYGGSSGGGFGGGGSFGGGGFGGGFGGGSFGGGGASGSW